MTDYQKLILKTIAKLKDHATDYNGSMITGEVDIREGLKGGDVWDAISLLREYREIMINRESLRAR